jgi:ATP-dependent RNA helicase UAP56/SUB2
LNEHEKNTKLIDLLNKIKFNQMIIFVESARHCQALSKLLTEQNISSVEVHRQIAKEEWFVIY